MWLVRLMPQQTHVVWKRAITSQVEHIGGKCRRGKGQRLLESVQDREDVIKCYRKIEELFRRLNVRNSAPAAIAETDW